MCTIRWSSTARPAAVSRAAGRGNMRRTESTPARSAPCTDPMVSCPASRSKTALSVASHRRRALPPIVSKTGCASVVEPLMTRRISLVAVCCSRASVSARFRVSSSGEQPHVLDGDHRLVGERLEERDLLGREGIGPRPANHEDDAQRLALPEQRRRQDCPATDPACTCGTTVPGTPPRPPRCPRRGSSAARARLVQPTVSRPTRDGIADRQWTPQRSVRRHQAQDAPLPGGRSTHRSPRRRGRRSRRPRP